MGEENKDREQKILSILDQEIEEGEEMAAEARKIVGYLLLEKKGYQPADLQKSVVFPVELDRERATSSVDFLIGKVWLSVRSNPSGMSGKRSPIPTEPSPGSAAARSRSAGPYREGLIGGGEIGCLRAFSSLSIVCFLPGPTEAILLKLLHYLAVFLEVVTRMARFHFPGNIP